MGISLRVGDLLFSECVDFAELIELRAGAAFGFWRIWRRESTYLGMQILKVRNGEENSAWAKLRLGNYDRKIGYGKIIPGRGKGGEFLTECEQSILRSALWKLMRGARISMPVPIYDASVAAPTLEEVDEFRNNNIDFGENATEIVSESSGDCANYAKKVDLSNIPGYGDSQK